MIHKYLFQSGFLEPRRLFFAGAPRARPGGSFDRPPNVPPSPYDAYRQELDRISQDTSGRGSIMKESTKPIAELEREWKDAAKAAGVRYTPYKAPRTVTGYNTTPIDVPGLPSMFTGADDIQPVDLKRSDVKRFRLTFKNPNVPLTVFYSADPQYVKGSNKPQGQFTLNPEAMISTANTFGQFFIADELPNGDIVCILDVYPPTSQYSKLKTDPRFQFQKNTLKVGGVGGAALSSRVKVKGGAGNADDIRDPDDIEPRRATQKRKPPNTDNPSDPTLNDKPAPKKFGAEFLKKRKLEALGNNRYRLKTVDMNLSPSAQENFGKFYKYIDFQLSDKNIQQEVEFKADEVITEDNTDGRIVGVLGDYNGQTMDPETFGTFVDKLTAAIDQVYSLKKVDPDFMERRGFALSDGKWGIDVNDLGLDDKAKENFGEHVYAIDVTLTDDKLGIADIGFEMPIAIGSDPFEAHGDVLSVTEKYKTMRPIGKKQIVAFLKELTEAINKVYNFDKIDYDFMTKNYKFQKHGSELMGGVSWKLKTYDMKLSERAQNIFGKDFDEIEIEFTSDYGIKEVVFERSIFGDLDASIHPDIKKVVDRSKTVRPMTQALFKAFMQELTSTIDSVYNKEPIDADFMGRFGFVKRKDRQWTLAKDKLPISQEAQTFLAKQIKGIEIKLSEDNAGIEWVDYNYPFVVAPFSRVPIPNSPSTPLQALEMHATIQRVVKDYKAVRPMSQEDFKQFLIKFSRAIDQVHGTAKKPPSAPPNSTPPSSGRGRRGA